jgi:alcohol dehydrogenase class IV
MHCPPNPSLSFAESIKVPKGITEIVSQGGGSTMDVGKWLAFKHNLKHTAIPTTAGTGSEATRYAVLTVRGKKRTFDLKKPDDYILNPELIVSLPPLQTLSTGLDAMCQAYESLWSKNATDRSRYFAKVALENASEYLKKSIDDPTNIKYRRMMLIAAHYSGRAIEITRTNVCHAISYPLTELYDIPHGIACAMSLDYFCKMMNIEFKFFFINEWKHKIDPVKIAEIAIKSEKLLDFPLSITKDDIIKSLS